MNKSFNLIVLITTVGLGIPAMAQTSNRAAPTDGPGMAGASTAGAKTGPNGIVIEGKTSKGIVIEGRDKLSPGGNAAIGPKPDEPLTASGKSSIGPKPDEPLNPSSKVSTGPLVNPKSGAAALKNKGDYQKPLGSASSTPQ